MDDVDVLIVGAGPAGLMMALLMQTYGVKTRVIEQRASKVATGHAAGLQCRTLEIFDSFGIGAKAWDETNHLIEFCMWESGGSTPQSLRRIDRFPDTPPHISRFQQANINQGRIERYLLDQIKNKDSRRPARDQVTHVHIDYATKPIRVFSVPDDPDHPIGVQVQHLTEAEVRQQSLGENVGSSQHTKLNFVRPHDKDEHHDVTRSIAANTGKTEEIRTRFLIGADGAHSWVREQHGIRLEGDSSDCVWGVVDVVPITDFPDIRCRCTIRSAEYGNLMIIPREDNLVRLYTQLTDMSRDSRSGGSPRMDKSQHNPKAILEKACSIMAPYSLEIAELNWWTVYQVGQRVAPKFSAGSNVFLVGDAVHTHSPKAGQGLNAAIQDAYNLGWKLGGFIKEYWKEEVVATYEPERRSFATDLIDLDFQLSKLLSSRDLRSQASFKSTLHNSSLLITGVGISYDASCLTIRTDHPKMSRITTGCRIPSFKVLNQADGRPWHLHSLLGLNLRVVIFTPDLQVSDHRTRLLALANKLAATHSFVSRSAPFGQRQDPVIDVLLVHPGPRTALEITEFPQFFRTSNHGRLWNYDKIFVDDESYHEGHAHAYDSYGIDKSRGCAIVVRPDQHVGWIGGWDDYGGMDRYFSGFMIDRSDEVSGNLFQGEQARIAPRTQGVHVTRTL